MLLEGKKAIITGGTRGIGYAIACRFIEEGAAVTVFGSRQETADAAVEKLTAAYPEAKVWGRSCDLTSLDAVTEAFTQAAADMGGLDTVVNNAGISQRSPLLNYTAEEFAKVMDLNVVAVFNGHQAAAKIMTEAGHGGTITTTSSMVAKYGQPSGVGYPTSKFAVNGMVQSLSRELAPMGIRVNAVAPGVTKTDMVANLPEEVIKPIIATIPLGRMGEPEDVANAFVFLASDMSSYVTGAILPFDGAARSSRPQATDSNLRRIQCKTRAARINRRQRAFFCLDGNRIPAFLATCRRRPRLLLVRRAPTCGGGIRARRAWRVPGGVTCAV